MKKYIISSFFLGLSSICAFAQTTTTNSGTSTTGQTIISPAPGIYIQPSAWLSSKRANAINGANDVNVNNNNSVNNDKTDSSKVQSAVTPEIVASAPVSALPASAASSVLPAGVKKITVPVKKDVYTNSISGWNRTTQQNIESQAQEKLQQQYQDFLNQDK